MCALWLVAAPAQAAEADEQALAASLFREGKALIEGGQLAGACEKFAESQRLEPKLGTLLYLATCHEQTGRVASAWAEYEQAAAMAARSKEPERQRLASERARALEPRLARLRIVLEGPPPPPGAELLLDGKKLGLASANVALPVDPGSHTVELSAMGRKPWRLSLLATPGATVDVAVPALEAVEPEAPPAPPPRAPEAPPPPAIAPATFVLGGVAVVGLAVGAGFGASFLSQRNDGLRECDSATCTARGLEQLDSARSASLISGVAFGVGAAAGVAAVVVHVLGVGRGSGAVTVAWTSSGARVGGAF